EDDSKMLDESSAFLLRFLLCPGMDFDKQPPLAAHHDLSNESPSPADGFVGMYRHKTAVYGLLDLESKDCWIWNLRTVSVLLAFGASMVSVNQHLRNVSSTTNVNNIYQKRISPSLLKHLTSKKSSDTFFDVIKLFLVNRHVLLVIDVVHDTHHEQLKDAMKVSRWLGPGTQLMRKQIYLPLRYEEALQLFSLCAFKMPYPPVGFEGFSIRAVHFAGRLPLALKVLGSLLFEKKRITVELEQYVGADEEYSASYHMLL
ncbi:hypothetical protein N665_0567s0014, partial [Sinapis alba]